MSNKLMKYATILVIFAYFATVASGKKMQKPSHGTTSDNATQEDDHSCAANTVTSCVAEWYVDRSHAGTLKDTLCSMLPVLLRCAKDADCSDPTLLSFLQGGAAASDYLCKPETLGYLLSEDSNCYSDQKSIRRIQQKLKKCQYAGLGSIYMSTDFDVCSLIMQMIDCGYDVVEDECDEEVAKFSVTVALKLLQPWLTQLLECTLDERVSAGGEYRRTHDDYYDDYN